MATSNPPNAERLREYAADPMPYFADTIIPAAGDPRLGDAWAEFQREAFQVMAVCLLAVVAGQKPPYRGIFLDRIKGASKDTDVGLGLNYALLFARRPILIEVAADDFNQAKETHGAMADDIRLNPWKGERLTVRKDRVINEQTGSECKFLTRDEFGAHGSRPAITVCNELSHIQSEGFASTVLDNATKIPNNLTIFATNAGFLQTWQHGWRELYRENERWWFQHVTETPPWQDEADIEEARGRNSLGRFNRLFKGIWSPLGGEAIKPEWIARADVADSPLPFNRAPYDHGAGIGIDAGLESHHASMVVLLTDYYNQKIRVGLVRDFPPPVRIGDLEDAAMAAREQYGASFLIADPWQTAGMVQRLQGRGWDARLEYPVETTLNRQATALMESLRLGQLEVYHGGDGDLLMEDLYSTRVIDKMTSNILKGYKLEWPENENGHCDRAAALVNILPYALEALGLIPDYGEHVAGTISELRAMYDRAAAFQGAA